MLPARLRRRRNKTDKARGILPVNTTQHLIRPDLFNSSACLPNSNTCCSQTPAPQKARKQESLRGCLSIRPSDVTQSAVDESAEPHRDVSARGKFTSPLSRSAQFLRRSPQWSSKLNTTPSAIPGREEEQFKPPQQWTTSDRVGAAKKKKTASTLEVSDAHVDIGILSNPPPPTIASKPFPPTPPTAIKNEPEKLLLACPFWKKDAQTYHACRLNRHTRFKDVKQHLKRKHAEATIHCTSCFEVFGSAESLANHQRSLQRCELQQSQSRGKSSTEQWMNLWRILFPGMKPPQSPYLDNSSDELLPRLQAFWLNNRAEITAETLGQTESSLPAQPEVQIYIFDRLVQCLLERFETSSAVPCSTPSPCPSPDMAGEECMSTASTVVEDFDPRKDYQTEDPFFGCPESSSDSMQDLFMGPYPFTPLSYPSQISLVSNTNYESPPSDFGPLGHGYCSASELECSRELDPVRGDDGMLELGNIGGTNVMDIEWSRTPQNPNRNTVAGFVVDGMYVF